MSKSDGRPARLSPRESSSGRVVIAMTTTYDLANDLGGDMPEKEAKTGESAFARWRDRRREKQRRAAEIAAKVHSARNRDLDRAASRDLARGGSGGA
jgi:hypothetical protein